MIFLLQLKSIIIIYKINYLFINLIMILNFYFKCPFIFNNNKSAREIFTLL